MDAGVGIDVDSYASRLRIEPGRRGNFNRPPVVDPAQSKVINTIAVGRVPGDAAIDSPTRTAFVPNADDDSVSVIDLDHWTVIDTIPVGDQPVAATVDPDAHTVYVTNYGSATVL